MLVTSVRQEDHHYFNRSLQDYAKKSPRKGDDPAHPRLHFHYRCDKDMLAFLGRNRDSGLFFDTYLDSNKGELGEQKAWLRMRYDESSKGFTWRLVKTTYEEENFAHYSTLDDSALILQELHKLCPDSRNVSNIDSLCGVFKVVTSFTFWRDELATSWGKISVDEVRFRGNYFWTCTISVSENVPVEGIVSVANEMPLSSPCFSKVMTCVWLQTDAQPTPFHQELVPQLYCHKSDSEDDDCD